MGLLEDLKAVGPYRRGGTCTIGMIYKELVEESEELAKTFAERSRDKEMDQTGFIDVMRSHGYNFTKHTLARHRRNDCLCHEVIGI